MRNLLNATTCGSRRKLLLLGGVYLGLPPSRSIGRPLAETLDITQPESPNDDGFMKRALDMRERAVELGDQPFGAVVVDAGRIVGQSWSRVVIDRDPTAHAELSAIRDACRRLQSGSLSGAILYSTSRPCPMCSAAAYWAGISGMIHGEDLRDGGVPTLCRT